MNDKRRKLHWISGCYDHHIWLSRGRWLFRLHRHDPSGLIILIGLGMNTDYQYAVLLLRRWQTEDETSRRKVIP